MDLKSIKEFLIENRIYAADKMVEGDIPYPCLEVLLEDEISGDFILQLGFIPGIEDQLEHVQLLQFFIPIIELPKDYPAVVFQFIASINNELALPGFTIDVDNELVFYRYVLPLSIKNGDEINNELLEVLNLCFFLVSQYAGALKKILA